MRIAVLTSLFLFACAAPAVEGPASRAASQAASVANKASSMAASAPAEMGLTGILGEEAFKALHVLRTDLPPRARGKDMKLSDGSAAYLSLPAGDGPHPGVIVIHEWWGLNDNIRHWADRLAADGYAALAVDLYAGRVATVPNDAMTFMKSVKADEAKATLMAAYKMLTTDDRIKAPKVGSIGWCFGGGWSLQAALNMPALDAAVIYYGRLVTDAKALGAINAKALGIFGNLDKGIPPASVDAFEAAMKTAGRDLKVLRFDANHAFANPSSGRYDQPSAEKAFAAVRTFFSANLK
ncbi:MAG: dienelactone hydrolase family protein [Myxococcota bacterium]